MELPSSASLTSVSLGDVDGFGGLLGIPLGQPHTLETLGTKRRRYDMKLILNQKVLCSFNSTVMSPYPLIQNPWFQLCAVYCGLKKMEN
jgi:hypothetical protein